MECKYIKQGIRINEDGSVVPCCDFSGNLGISYSSSFTLESYLESTNVSELHSNLANDEWPRGCKNCANNEARKHLSLRQRAQAEAGDGLILDLVIGNECNSDCVMCHAGQSSKIDSRIRNKKPDFPVSNEDAYWVQSSPIGHNWANDPAFWEKISDSFDSINTIKFLGGEPLLNKKLWHWLDSTTVNAGKKDKILSIVTNASIVNESKMHLLEGWKQTIITISIDAIGNEYEWIRHGLDWDSVSSNIKRFQQIKDAHVSIHATVNLYNIAIIDRLLQWAEDNSLLFVLSPVLSPSLLSVQHAPIDILNESLERLANFKTTAIQNKIQMIGLRNIIKNAISNNRENPDLRRQMTSYFNSHRKHIMDWKTLRCTAT